MGVLSDLERHSMNAYAQALMQQQLQGFRGTDPYTGNPLLSVENEGAESDKVNPVVLLLKT